MGKAFLRQDDPINNSNGSRFMPNNFLEFVFIVALIFTQIIPVNNAQAACTNGGVCEEYLSNFGSVLVGAVQVQKDVIWINNDNGSAIVTSDGASTFAFRGVEAYFDQLTNMPPNQWAVEGINFVHIKGSSGDNKLDLFFAPSGENQYTSTISVTSDNTATAKPQKLSGIGVADTGNLLDLRVDVYRHYSDNNCLIQGTESISNCSPLNTEITPNKEISISANDKLSFVIAPVVDSKQLPVGITANYAKIYISAYENGCTSPIARESVPIDSNGKLIGSGEIDFINQYPVSRLPDWMTRGCNRVYSFFIAEMNKPFEFQTTVNNTTGTTRSVNYRFYAEGHQSTPTGNVTVKLSSSEKPVDLNKTLVIQVIGNGKVTGKVNNKDIECTSTNECRETFIMSETSTTLTATPLGTESLQWAGACSSNSGTATEAKVVLNEDKVCFAIFTATDTPINQNSPLGGISARSYVGSSPSQYLYAGIKLGKTTKVMIRGLGKSLLSQGVPEALDDAKLTVRKEDGTIVDSNDNWQQHSSANELLQHQHPDPSDAAMIITLPEGLYSAELSSVAELSSAKEGKTGIGLLEVYEAK